MEQGIIIQFRDSDKVSIYNPCFDVTRNELDIALKSAVSEMIDKDLTNSSVTLKLDICATTEAVADRNAQSGCREAKNIEIGAKVGYTLQFKSEAKFDVVSAKHGKELVMDSQGEYSMVSHEEASGQLSMFNSWNEYKAAMEQ